MSNPEGTKKNSRFFQKVKQQADDSKNLRCETLYISNYEYVNVSLLLCQILSYGWKKMATEHTSTFIFVKIYSVEGSKLMHDVVVWI